jgi:hypothetical protein
MRRAVMAAGSTAARAGGVEKSHASGGGRKIF